MRTVTISFSPQSGNIYKASIDMEVIPIINGEGKIDLKEGETYWLVVAAFGTPGQTITVTMDGAKTTSSGETSFEFKLTSSGPRAGRGQKMRLITVD